MNNNGEQFCTIFLIKPDQNGENFKFLCTLYTSLKCILAFYNFICGFSIMLSLLKKKQAKSYFWMISVDIRKTNSNWHYWRERTKLTQLGFVCFFDDGQNGLLTGNQKIGGKITFSFFRYFQHFNFEIAIRKKNLLSNIYVFNVKR